MGMISADSMVHNLSMMKSYVGNLADQVPGSLTEDNVSSLSRV